jgi:hypothetical protein
MGNKRWNSLWETKYADLHDKAHLRDARVFLKKIHFKADCFTKQAAFLINKSINIGINDGLRLDLSNEFTVLCTRDAEEWKSDKQVFVELYCPIKLQRPK